MRAPGSSRAPGSIVSCGCWRSTDPWRCGRFWLTAKPCCCRLGSCGARSSAATRTQPAGWVLVARGVPPRPDPRCQAIFGGGYRLLVSGRDQRAAMADRVARTGGRLRAVWAAEGGHADRVSGRRWRCVLRGAESLAGVLRRAERFHVGQILRSSGCLFVGDQSIATNEEHRYAPIRSLLLGVPGRVPVHTGNVCHHVDLHGLTPQLQDAALLKHILSCDLFRRKAKLL